jgi:invasion protein IalB
MKRLVLCGLAMVLMGLGAPVSGAAEETVFKDWALRSSEESAQWVLEQRVFIEGNDEAPLVRVAIQRLDAKIEGKETDRLWTVLTVPLNVLLQPGLQLSIDDGETMGIAFHHCRAGGCIAIAPLEPRLRGDLEGGLKAQVGFHVLNGQRVGVPVSLMGIKAGIAALEKKTSNEG